jgi:hypothetical protein
VELLTTILAWTLGGAVVVDLVNAVAGADPAPAWRSRELDTSHLRLKSLKLVGRVVVAFVLIMLFTSRRNSRSNVACIDQLPSWKPRSTPISKPVTPIQNRSDGPNLPTTSSHRSNASAAEQSALTKQLHRNFRIGTLVWFVRFDLVAVARQGMPQLLLK